MCPVLTTLVTITSQVSVSGNEIAFGIVCGSGETGLKLSMRAETESSEVGVEGVALNGSGFDSGIDSDFLALFLGFFKAINVFVTFDNLNLISNNKSKNR
jgi:hypothetical protein